MYTADRGQPNKWYAPAQQRERERALQREATAILAK